MAKQIADEEDSLRRRARRRLIGAVALTTAVVVLLPMILDSEPRPSGQDIELRIPDKDKVGEFVPEVPQSASAVSAVVPEHAVSQPASVAEAVPVIAPPTLPAEAKEKSVPAKPEPVVHDSEASPQLKPSAQLSSVKPEPAADKHADKASSFVVQFGAFSSADAAHKLQQKLAQQGIKVYTEKSGDKLRVRAGPYATREAADKVKHKLEAQGMHPVVSPTR